MKPSKHTPANPNTEILREMAAWCDRKAAWLKHKREAQLAVDPMWVDVELDPQGVEAMADGFENIARVFRTIADD